MRVISEDIQLFMENSANQSFISQKAREEFQAALDELASTATITAANS